MENTKITIVGTGSWGTALAISFHNASKHVQLWGRRTELVYELCALRHSPYLPGTFIPPTLPITSDIEEIATSDIILWAVPVQQSQQLLELVKSYIPSSIPIIICSKGLELESQQPLSSLFKNALPNPVGVLSGPNFADEIAKGLPAASTLAFEDLELAKKISHQLRHTAFRVYAHHDVIGVELAGALKNVIAIASGVVMGKELGQNCLATLITRSNAEIGRLICALGGAKETRQTLAGIGDLILTCSSTKSRNTSLGIALAQGQSLEDILKSRKNVTEGIATAKVAFELVNHHHVHAPIIHAVHDILYIGKPINDVVQSLLSHQQEQELE
jgi:glycerol-3-phosphate dehydrogenase (NAD(P)+)